MSILSAVLIICKLGSSDKKRKLADEAYDLTDENFQVDVPEKLSTFRLVLG